MITVQALVPYLAGALAAGGIAVVASRRREMIRRWCAWAIGIPLVAGAFWLGPPGAAALAAAAAVIAALEYGALMRAPWPDRVVLAIALVAVIGTVWLAPEQVLRAVGAGAVLIGAVPLLAGDTTGGLRRAGSGVLGLVWLAPLAAVVPLGATALVLFAAVSIGDIAAYVAGRRLGGPRLSPLSPAKRWSGTIAGAAVAVGVLVVFGVFSRDLRPSLIVGLVAAVAVGAPLGDLFESMIKRGAGVKDAAGWLAGSGGLLDRIDSLLAALAVTLLLS
ncbi:phosphatidate cytidylyltransferase [Krasilnikovia sp. MM14-A1004]|uniref:phosphatidate cytidylyltransferase n=1 Tax=Krasilnikovia sp. MM14-A1004 TaxID=3373541 RepID=UPI00399C64D7